MKLNEEKIGIKAPDFCERDCPCRELEITTVKVFISFDEEVEMRNIAVCKNEEKCTMLLKKFKEDLINSGEVEENIKRNKSFYKINGPFD